MQEETEDDKKIRELLEQLGFETPTVEEAKRMRLARIRADIQREFA